MLKKYSDWRRQSKIAEMTRMGLPKDSAELLFAQLGDLRRTMWRGMAVPLGLFAVAIIATAQIYSGQRTDNLPLLTHAKMMFWRANCRQMSPNY